MLRTYEIDVNSFIYRNIRNNKNITEKDLEYLLYATNEMELSENSKWTTSYNGSTLRHIVMTETTTKNDEKILNFTIKDVGFNKNEQNPPYHIVILRKYIHLQEIKYFRLETFSNGNFYLFFGDRKRIKIFWTKLYSLSFIAEIDKFSFFSTDTKAWEEKSASKSQRPIKPSNPIPRAGYQWKNLAYG